MPALFGDKMPTTGLQGCASAQELDMEVLNNGTISIDPRDLQENVRRIVHIMFTK